MISKPWEKKKERRSKKTREKKSLSDERTDRTNIWPRSLNPKNCKERRTKEARYARAGEKKEKNKQAHPAVAKIQT